MARSYPAVPKFLFYFAAFTIAKMPDFSAAGSVGHAFATSAKSGDSLAKSAKKRDSFSASDSQVLLLSAVAEGALRFCKPDVPGSNPGWRP